MDITQNQVKMDSTGKGGSYFRQQHLYITWIKYFNIFLLEQTISIV